MINPKVFLCLLLLITVSCATTSVEDAKKAQAHYKLGVSYLSGGNIQPAYVEFQTALQLDPNSKETHNALGNVYLALSDIPAAEEQFQSAIRIDPKYSDAHNNLCYAYYLQKQWDKSIASCKSALSNPLYVTAEKAYYNMGRAYYRKGSYDEAIDAYINSLRRMPGLYLANYGLALSYNAKKQYGKAAEAMTQAINADPEFRGDRDKAEKEFSNQVGKSDEPADLRDYIEILHY